MVRSRFAVSAFDAFISHFTFLVYFTHTFSHTRSYICVCYTFCTRLRFGLRTPATPLHTHLPRWVGCLRFARRTDFPVYTAFIFILQFWLRSHLRGCAFVTLTFLRSFGFRSRLICPVALPTFGFRFTLRSLVHFSGSRWFCTPRWQHHRRGSRGSGSPRGWFTRLVLYAFRFRCRLHSSVYVSSVPLFLCIFIFHYAFLGSHTHTKLAFHAFSFFTRLRLHLVTVSFVYAAFYRLPHRTLFKFTFLVHGLHLVHGYAHWFHLRFTVWSRLRFQTRAARIASRSQRAHGSFFTLRASTRAARIALRQRRRIAARLALTRLCAPRRAALVWLVSFASS